MKKLVSILFVIVILFSGLHLTIATHFCGGEIAAVKWSLSGEKAGCGMNDVKSESAASFESDCCHDQLAAFNLDHDYAPSTFQLPVVSQQLVPQFLISVFTFVQNFSPQQISYASVHQPGNLQPSDVYLSDICVFRI